MKKYIEMRGADAGPWRSICALPALWVGLLYDEEAKKEALALISEWTQEDRDYLYVEAPKTGLKTPFKKGTMQDLAMEVMGIARRGLVRRGNGEESLLDRIADIVTSGVTPAERLLELYHGEWNEDLEPLYSKYTY